MKQMKTLLLILSFGFLSACVTQTTIQDKVEFNTDIEHQYPALSIYYKDASQELNNECIEFDSKSLLHHCRVNSINLDHFKQSLLDTNLFKGVGFNDFSNDYSLSITTARYNLEDAAELTQAVISGASLMLIPMETSENVKVEMELKWKGTTIKTYEYELPLNESFSLFSFGSIDKAVRNFSENLVSNFIKDYQEEKVYSGEYLLKKLNASNYETDLTVPEIVLDYAYQGLYVYPDPLLGAQARYQHLILSGLIDVYIYPIKSTSWNNTEQILKDELDLVKKEIQILQQREIYKDASISEHEVVSLALESGSISGMKFYFTYFDEYERDFISLTYLFIEKDKILKFRSTRQDPDVEFEIESFITAFLDEIDPPDESIYMSELRYKIKQNTITNEE